MSLQATREPQHAETICMPVAQLKVNTMQQETLISCLEVCLVFFSLVSDIANKDPKCN